MTKRIDKPNCITNTGNFQNENVTHFRTSAR